MTNYGKTTIRFRVYALGTNDKYDDIYDELYLAENQELAEKENLICCELTCKVDSALETFDWVRKGYEGMTYSIDAIVDGKVEHIIGGICDPYDYEYIEEWLNGKND